MLSTIFNCVRSGQDEDASSVIWVKRVKKAVRNGLQFLTAVMALRVGPSQ
ncbi:hypothetical protein LEMLEM_LOCUS13607 [Lemmus lemmus]